MFGCFSVDGRLKCIRNEVFCFWWDCDNCRLLYLINGLIGYIVVFVGYVVKCIFVIFVWLLGFLFFLVSFFV